MLKVKTQEEKNQLKKELFNKNELELTDLENCQSISTLEKKNEKGCLDVNTNGCG